MSEAALERIVRFYESIAPADLDRLESLYAADARFKDPFNEVTGVPAIRRVFEHMFEQLAAPRFVVRERILQGDSAFLVWDFDFELRTGRPAGPMRIRGGTHLRFDVDGRVVLHRDYWDAAEELYEKLPLIGAAMRWMRRRGAAGPAR